MKGILDRVGFLVEDTVYFESSPEIVSLGSRSIKDRRLFSLEIGFIVDGGGYSGLSGYRWG